MRSDLTCAIASWRDFSERFLLDVLARRIRTDHRAADGSAIAPAERRNSAWRDHSRSSDRAIGPHSIQTA
jgi:hypothetical protein